MATDTDGVGFAPVQLNPNEVPTQAASVDLTQPHDVPAGTFITIS